MSSGRRFPSFSLGKRTTAWVCIAYGVLLITFGFIGYFRAASLASLLSGGISGVLLCLCALGIWAKHAPSLIFARYLTLLLTGLFLYRYLISDKTLPLIFAILSAVLFFVLIRQKKREGKEKE